MTAANASDFNDLGAFEFDELTNENQYTEEEDMNFFANFELPADLLGNGGTIKFGARGRFKTKERNNDFFEYDFEDLYPTLADLPPCTVSILGSCPAKPSNGAVTCCDAALRPRRNL